MRIFIKALLLCDCMDSHILDCYIRAGKIASKVREKSRKWVREGERLLDVAEKIEAEIKSLGGVPAFPVNISVNDVAAHFTPTEADKNAFKKDDVVKIDLGAHIEGCIADTAATIYLGSGKSEKSLVAASESALKAALALATPGRKIPEISAKIEETIRSHGFVPVSNLSGHYLGMYEVHASPSIPNVRTASQAVLSEGEVIAIEPFATTGAGYVKETGRVMIFSFAKAKPARLPAARAVLEFAKGLGGLPFASRWIREPAGLVKDRALSELVALGALHAYPVLKEESGGLVSQAEHTVIVGKKPRVTTE